MKQIQGEKFKFLTEKVLSGNDSLINELNYAMDDPKSNMGNSKCYKPYEVTPYLIKSSKHLPSFT